MTDFKKGYEALKDGKYEIAHDIFLPLARDGDVEAQFCMGWICYVPDTKLKNDKVAVSWFKAASDQGHVNAKFNLGVMCVLGLGVEPNDNNHGIGYHLLAEATGQLHGQVHTLLEIISPIKED